MEFGFCFAKQGGNIMRIVELTDESKNNILENLLKRSPNSYGKFESAVAEILLNIRQRAMRLYLNILRILIRLISMLTILS